jgi:hypothetical protein
MRYNTRTSPDDDATGTLEAFSMYHHVVTCSHPRCSERAAFKVASRWSEGSFSELKTFGFACSEHLGAVYQNAEERCLDYRLRPGEATEEISIYRLEPGKRDRHLERLRELEENYHS